MIADRSELIGTPEELAQFLAAEAAQARREFLWRLQMLTWLGQWLVLWLVFGAAACAAVWGVTSFWHPAGWLLTLAIYFGLSNPWRNERR